MKHAVIIDTLTMSFKYNNVSNLIFSLNLQDLTFQPTRNIYYTSGQYVPGINIMWNTDQYGDITDCMIHLSGTGCRLVESLNPGFDWFGFLYSYDAHIRDKTSRISRLDIACDVTDGSLPISTVQKYVRSYLYVCRSKCLPLVSYERERIVYIGSPQSNRLLRIYDKALEQGIPDVEWTRVEMQLRNVNATSFYLNWCQNSNIGELYSGVLHDYIRFIKPTKNIRQIKANRHQSRIDTVRWWSDFLGDVKRIPQLYLPGIEFTLDRLDTYIEKRNSGPFKAYLIAHSGDLSKLLSAAHNAKLNPKYRVLLDNLQLIQSDLNKETFEFVPNMYM